MSSQMKHDGNRMDFQVRKYLGFSSLIWLLFMTQTVKESACNTGNLGLIPESEKSTGERNGYPLQYSCLENSMDRGAWWATFHGVTKSQTWPSDWHFSYCSSEVPCILKGVVQGNSLVLRTVVQSITRIFPRSPWGWKIHQSRVQLFIAESGNEICSFWRNLAREEGSIPGWRRSPGDGIGNPL